jgi:hypothetical protein
MAKATSSKGKEARTPPGPWQKHFFRRHRNDDPTEAVPARDFLEACPEKVRAMMLAVVNAVAEAPPPQFSGGGKWEAMHKPFRTLLSTRDYADVRRLGGEYLARHPRSILR